MSDSEDDILIPPPGFLNEEGEELTLEQTAPPSAVLPPTGHNPFRHRAQPGSDSPTAYRDHFPAFDLAIKDHSSSPSSSSSKSNSPDGLNRSNVSSAGASHASFMSIGMKAALYEHNRHIAKYGLDNSPSNSNSNSSNNSPRHGDAARKQQEDSTEAITPPRDVNPLEEYWGQLLDGQQEAPSVDSSASDKSHTSPPGLDRIDTIVSVSTGDMEGTESIEVSPKAQVTDADLSSIRQSAFSFDADTQSRSSRSTASFFNSARVHQLRTPERNRNGTAEGFASITLRRGSAEYPTSPSILEEPSLLSDQASPNMAQMFQALTVGASPPPLDSSFASFAVGADLSRISGTGDSPEHSFQRPLHGSLFSSWDEEDLQQDSPMLDLPPPPPPPQSARKYPIQQARDPRSSSWAGHQIAPSLSRSLSPPKQRRPLLQKQQSCPEATHSPLRWAEEPVFSAAAQQAGMLALAKQSQLTQEHPPPTGTLMDFFQEFHPESASSQSSPRLFAAANTSSIQEGPSLDDLSTIQNESSSARNNTSSSSSSMKRRARQQPQFATPTSLNKSILSSSSSSSVHPSDRRRYRTVVPSRVFLKEEPKEGFFPVARDSFSAEDPPAVATAESQEEAALLQDSFEAAYQVSLLEDAQTREQGEEKSEQRRGLC